MSEADTETNRWVARPWAARSVRIAVYAIPLVLSIVASITLTSLLAGPLTVFWSVARWGLIVLVSTAVLIATERVSRRLLPLATLFKLSLAFPDRVPSRFGIALRIGTTAQLQQRIDAAQRGEIAESEDEAAEELLELVGLLSHHDRLTRGHSERVRAYTHLVGVEMGITGDELDRLRWSALLHDIGKITIPGAILNKPGRLTDEEFDTIKTHPTAGKKLVAPLADWLGTSVRAVWEHHERFDGGGYPAGLAGSEIALASRIVCVTDAFDVMTSARSYKKPMTAAAARAELSRCAGTQFDPVVVRAFVAASIGTTQTATKPLSVLAQLFLFPRRFLGNLTATVGAATALAAGTVVGTFGPTLAAELSPTPPPVVSIDEEEPPATSTTSSPIVELPEAPAASTTTVEPPSGANANTPAPSVPTRLGTTPRDPEPDGPTPVTTTTVPTVTTTPVTTTTEPRVTVPPGTVPPVTVPPVTVPPATVPNVTTPNVSIPVVTIPVITIPVVTIPSVTVPIVTVTLPPVVVSVPPVSVPPVTVPVTVPSVTIPVTIPPVTIPGGLL